MGDFRQRYRAVTVAVVLAVLTVLLYLPVRHHAFVDYDDHDYVTNNAHIKKGLTGEAVVWAFTSGYASNWHPLTWLRHMVDCELYGDRAGGHHLTNLLLHALNGAAAVRPAAAHRLALAQRVGGRALRWHPLHVESVAWVGERKDVLSGLFWLLTIWAYARYVERRSKQRYAVTLGFFALGLMSKPMVVTLPCVLLLLDWWPLRRWPGRGRRRAGPGPGVPGKPSR